MRSEEIECRIARELGCRSWYLKIALGIISTVAVASLLRAIYLIGYVAGQDSVDPFGAAVSNNDFPYIINGFRLVIALGLVAAAVGLWLNRVVGFFFSTLALALVAAIYGRWYCYSMAFLRNVEVPSYTDLNSPDLQHAGWLHGTSWWDVVVLGATGTLLLWHVWMSVKILANVDKDGSSFCDEL